MEERQLLTTEEILLLENLMYLPQAKEGELNLLEQGQGGSVGELVDLLEPEEPESPGESSGDGTRSGPESPGESSGDGTRSGPESQEASCENGTRDSQEEPEPSGGDRPRSGPGADLAGAGGCMAGGGWQELLKAVRQYPRLMQMRIHQVFRDTLPGGGGGLGALFLDVPAREAVVAFRGTARQEWQDNFQGGGYTDTPDRVSTWQQMRALNWYQSLGLEGYFVTVTGHSKGGNKAKYITILDDSVDRCLSFDGQGFSDEFVDWYKVRILLRSSRIENHNAEQDYVHLLLNDVGTSVYYRGRDYGKGDFLKNHCPNAFLLPDGQGGLHMERSCLGQTQALYWLGKFVREYLRSLTRKKKLDLLDLLGKEAGKLADGEPREALLLTFLEEQHREMAGDLVDYAFRYGQEHPEFSQAADWLLEQTGLGKLVWAVRLFRKMWEMGEDRLLLFTEASSGPT